MIFVAAHAIFELFAGPETCAVRGCIGIFVPICHGHWGADGSCCKRMCPSAGGSSSLMRHSAFPWETPSISVSPIKVLCSLGRINRSSGPEAQGSALYNVKRPSPNLSRASRLLPDLQPIIMALSRDFYKLLNSRSRLASVRYTSTGTSE